MQAQPMPSCAVCLSVCLSVTFVNFVKTSNRIFNIFSPLGSHTILVFPHQTSWQYSNEEILTGASNAGGVGTNRDYGRLAGYRSIDRSMTAAVRQAIGGRRCSSVSQVLCTSVYGTVTATHLWIYAEGKRTEQNSIVQSGKSEAEVRLQATYCTIEANYWQTRSIARPFCESRATCSLRFGNCNPKRG